MPLQSTLDAEANAAAAITATAPRYLHWLSFSYDAAPTGGKVSVVADAVTLFEVDVVAGGPQMIQFNPPVVNDSGEDMTITLAAGGADVIGKITALTG